MFCCSEITTQWDWNKGCVYQNRKSWKTWFLPLQICTRSALWCVICGISISHIQIHSPKTNLQINPPALGSRTVDVIRLVHFLVYWYGNNYVIIYLNTLFSRRIHSLQHIIQNFMIIAPQWRCFYGCDVVQNVVYSASRMNKGSLKLKKWPDSQSLWDVLFSSFFLFNFMVS